MKVSKTFTFILIALAVLALIFAYFPLIIFGRTQKIKDIPLRPSSEVITPPLHTSPPEIPLPPKISQVPMVKLGNGIEVYYDLSLLDAKIQKTRDVLLDASKTGRIERLGIAFQMNEMMPTFSRSPERDPVSYWKRKSGDKEGKEVLSVLANILNLPAARIKIGTPQEMVVFPYLAELPIKTLTDEQKVDLFRLLSPNDVKDLETIGSYVYWRLGIGKDGTLHYFLDGK